MTTTLPRLPTERVWMVAESFLQNALPENLNLRDVRMQRARRGFTRVGHVAVVDVLGPIEKHPSILGMLLGGSVYAEIAAAVMAAAADGLIDAIVLNIDSPGGTVAGSADAADAIFHARSRKPIIAAVSDMAASGGYLLASQATRVVANRTAWIGSIGTYVVVRDWSRAFEREGVKTHVVRAGRLKGEGVMGAPVSEDFLAELDRIVRETNAHFLSAVRRGRRMARERMEQLADGRLFVGEEAKLVGLIDAVQSFDDLLADLTRVPTGVDAFTEFNDRVRALTAGGVAQEEARARVARERPELFTEYERERCRLCGIDFDPRSVGRIVNPSQHRISANIEV